jgi:hypothetical protein
MRRVTKRSPLRSGASGAAVVVPWSWPAEPAVADGAGEEVVLADDVDEPDVRAPGGRPAVGSALAAHPASSSAAAAVMDAVRNLTSRA